MLLCFMWCRLLQHQFVALVACVQTVDKIKECLKMCRQDISQCKMLRQASGWQTQVFIYIQLKEKMLSVQLALPRR